jgi:hypothetical protein
MLDKPCRLALLVVASTLLAHTQTAASNPSTMTYREWKRLRAHARTAAEFHTLAEWARSKAELYRKKQADAEAALREYYANSGPQAVPKYPQRDLSIKLDIAHYRDLAKHWSEIEHVCFLKAVELRKD